MDPQRLTVVAIFVPKSGRAEELATALRAMVAPTRREEGCLNYDLHAANDGSGLLFFHETWASADHHRAHLDTLHVRHLLTITPDLLAEPIRELKGTRIEQ